MLSIAVAVGAAVVVAADGDDVDVAWPFVVDSAFDAGARLALLEACAAA